jgi:2-polyprenyl-3-methyl-5-hydroxy-6-metoxy-1,4-benzoquinol methylase
MELLPNYYSWTYGIFKEYIKGIVVELGCGAGMGIATYIDNAEKVYAVDHDDELLRRVDERFANGKVEAVSSDLLGDWRELSRVSADVVIMMDVVEHFEDDVSILENSAALVGGVGFLIVKVPAQRRLYSEMDRASGHYRRYDASDLVHLAHTAGLGVKALKTINPLGGLLYRFRNHARTNLSRTFSSGQLRLLNAALPLFSTLDLIPGLPGLSLVALLEKR